MYWESNMVSWVLDWVCEERTCFCSVSHVCLWVTHIQVMTSRWERERRHYPIKLLQTSRDRNREKFRSMITAYVKHFLSHTHTHTRHADTFIDQCSLVQIRADVILWADSHTFNFCINFSNAKSFLLLDSILVVFQKSRKYGHFKKSQVKERIQERKNSCCERGNWAVTYLQRTVLLVDAAA